ncbi:MAG: SpoIIE family protein phosphatase [Chlorobi bacterium]|nr:SpoIIE family protein phosphatase [Chlorobiota bacterium]
MKHNITIFRQILISVLIPVLIVLLIVEAINYQNTKSIMVASNSEKNAIISDEIKTIFEFQDISLVMPEDALNMRLKNISNTLVNKYFKNTNGIEKADLKVIQKEINMDPNWEDIYIINREGTIINTTFKKDLNLNLFQFGEDLKKFLENIFVSHAFLVDKYSIEVSTKKLKKFCYQTTLDGKYIIELGTYSKKANEVMWFIRKRLKEISSKSSGIVSVDYIINQENPFSLNSNLKIDENEKTRIQNIYKTKQSNEYKISKNGKDLHLEYIYIDKITDFFIGAVIRIVSDRTTEERYLRNELIKAIILFVITLSILSFIIYLRAKWISKPVRKLVITTKNIAQGNLSERAEIIGRNEIATLSVHFNLMIEQLQQSHDELEKSNSEINEQKNIIERKNKDIMDSIMYAKRIQEAILPPDKLVNKYLKNSFILYKPKDVVSGDFYWLEVLDDKVLFAAVDCTGHGVPGAFVSIVGNNGLNRAVNEFKLNVPGEILDKLEDLVEETLRQKENEVKDGMDIAICSLDYKTNTLCYAGAHNPLYVIRDKNLDFPEGELSIDEDEKRNLFEIKADRQPIGLHAFRKNFTNHTIQLKKNDTIFIFSDGFADQFGGPKGRKFKYKPFKRLLVSIQDKPIKEQRDILNKTIVDWRGDRDQIDDIVIIGVRI